MYAFRRHGWASAAALLVLATASAAHAWVETSIRSDVVTVDVDRDGSATVRHELLMRVRGGPLQGFDLEGVDSDAQLLPDAVVVEATSGTPPSSPVALLGQLGEGGTLRLEVDAEKGLRRGNYLFRIGYRTHLLERNLIDLRGQRAEVRWVGPRFPDGIDSAKVVFRLPPASTPPELAPTDLERDGLGPQELGGVFLSNLRRAADKDELEIVRPHVAKGEPVLWRVHADARAFDAFAAPAPPPATEPRGGGLGADAKQRGRVLGGAALVALLYSTLVWAKWRALLAACANRAEARALLPLPALLRAAASGMLLSLAGLLAAFADRPTLGGVLLVASMALAAHLTPHTRPTPRGPGRWLPLSDQEAFMPKKSAVPGRWLDATAPPGFVAFIVLLAGFAAGAIALLPMDPYHALLVALAAGCLLPLFLTGRGCELPADPAQAPRRLLRRLAQRLRRQRNLKVVAWARIPDGTDEADELRLLVLPRPALTGLTAIEVGMEYDQAGGGTLATPCVLVRALEGSAAHRELGTSVRWTRGKKPEERVAALRPKLPTFGLLASLVERVSSRLTMEAAPARRSHEPTPEARTARRRRPAVPREAGGASAGAPPERGSARRWVADG